MNMRKPKNQSTLLIMPFIIFAKLKILVSQNSKKWFQHSIKEAIKHNLHEA